MPDMQHFEHGSCPDEGVAQRLRDLPEQPPSSDGWARLAAELRRAQAVPRTKTVVRRARWPLALATAATVLLVLLWPRSAPELPAPWLDTVADSAARQDEAATAALVAQSQWLENLVAAPLLAPAAQDSDEVLLDWGLRQRIGDIDLALQAGDAGQRLPLWQARVDALSQLVQVRWAGRRQYLDDGVADGATVRHAVMWSN